MLVDVSVIIVNWNTRDLLARCLSCVYDNLGSLSSEVFVVDNASTDGSGSMVVESFPQVHLIQNEQNLGFARANNQALALAQGRYLLLLNSDAFLNHGALETMVKTMEAHPEAGAAGCRLYYEDGALQRSASAFSTLSTEVWQSLFLDRLFPKNPIFGSYRMTYWDLDTLREVDVVMGAVMLLRRQAIQQVGGLDEQFFMYSEEVDLCYRLKEAGWKVLYIPEATAIHIWGGSSRKIQGESFLQLYHARVQFFRKHYGRFPAAEYKLVLGLSSILRVAGGGIVSLVRKNKDLALSIHNYWRLLLSMWVF